MSPVNPALFSADAPLLPGVGWKGAQRGSAVTKAMLPGVPVPRRLHGCQWQCRPAPLLCSPSAASSHRVWGPAVPCGWLLAPVWLQPHHHSRSFMLSSCRPLPQGKGLLGRRQSQDFIPISALGLLAALLGCNRLIGMS